MLKPSLMGVPTGKPPVQQVQPRRWRLTLLGKPARPWEARSPNVPRHGVQDDGQALAKSKCASGFQVAFILPFSSRWFPPASLILSILRFLSKFLDLGSRSAVWHSCCALAPSITHSRAVVSCYLFFIYRWLHKSHSPYLQKKSKW